MALETFLLELAEAFPDALDRFLVQILRRSESGALTSVVASVATAYPHQAGESLLVLLSCRHCIELDKQRLVHEAQAASRFTEIMPFIQADKRIFDRERKTADALPHRSKDLEVAIGNLQLGSLQPRVYALLDAHRASLPQPDVQNERDKVWRLAIHRMDLKAVYRHR